MSNTINHFTWGGDFKSIAEQGLLEGDAIVFGSEVSPDISQFKDFFTKETYVHPDDEFTTALYMEHGFSYRKPIGKAKLKKTEKGWTAIAELNMDDPVVKSRFPEIKSGGWGFSTGAVGHVVERESKNNGTHFISQWSVGELSITRTPAEPKALVHTVKSLEEYYQAFEEDDLTENNEEPIMNETYFMKIIEMLITELCKKQIEEILKSDIEEIKSKLSEFKSNDSSITDEKLMEELTVLKSTNEELEAKTLELQSSFNEKEALLSEKMVLLSETQVEIESKSQIIIELENALKESQVEVESIKQKLEIQKEANRLLTQSKLN